MFNKQIKFGSTNVGIGNKTYFIAEIGANFDGSLDKAKKLCDAAKSAGADCAKFQSFISEKIVSARGFSKMKLNGVHGTWGRPVNEVFKDAEFPRDWHYLIKEHCDNIGIHFSTSPYDFEAVEMCVNLDLPFIKIGSGEITWLEMIHKIASTQKPIILATGDATLAEIDDAINVIISTGNKNLVLLQCITNYPSMIESANINVLKTYQSAFNVLTGYSDHSFGDVVILGATALGGCVVEKHFTLNKKDIGPDHPHSMDMNEFKLMIERVRQLEMALGSTRKFVVEEEQETVIVQRRGLYANRNIKKGDLISLNDIVTLRPALGILPKYKSIVVGKIAQKDIEFGDPIYWDNI
jgi:sialic acid synthase SpsE